MPRESLYQEIIRKQDNACKLPQVDCTVRAKRLMSDPIRKTALVRQARAYANANKADTFAFTRAMTHINMGMAGMDDYSNQSRL